MGDMQQDPSMEEILASIKRVIAEDGGPAAAARAPRRGPPPPEPQVADEDVLELDDPVPEAGGLVSEDAAAASRRKLAALSALRREEGAPVESGALDAVVREMLRPMLKDWLDRNLPEIVEALVTREIVRITGKKL